MGPVWPQGKPSLAGHATLIRWLQVSRLPMMTMIILMASMSRTEAALRCELLSVSRHAHDIHDAAIVGLGLDLSQTNLQMLQCTCPSTTDESFSDLDMQTMNTQLGSSANWRASHVLRIAECTQLTLSMNTGANTWSINLNGSMLIVENIQKLFLSSFSVGIPSMSYFKSTFTSIYMRNVNLASFPDIVRFQDRHEVLFSRISTTTGFSNAFVVTATNYMSSIDPVFTLEKSTFKGIDLFQNSGYNTILVTITVENFQRKDSISCNYDFKGQVNIVDNRFGYLRMRNIKLVNGRMLNMSKNYFDVIGEGAIYFSNMKKSSLVDNNFAFMITDPIISISFGHTNAMCSEPDLKESAVEMVDLSRNSMSRLNPETLEIDLDASYGSGFLNKFMVDDISVMKRCVCTLTPVTSGTSTPQVLDKQAFYKRVMEVSQCQINDAPFILGKRSDICAGRLPLTEQQKLEQSRKDLNTYWGIGLVLAILLSVGIAILATVLLIKHFRATGKCTAMY